ncbi:UDP-N-acetylmuramate dehydrogenase [Anaeropeptidivorans aminofermentans]|uniref:UDP-N-acetylmuramate dehydrogenase n=1 Tax=Anaeropeptidivorans aminofermentans TaxID=2934315 RepID=UPI0020256777|nr:UDP-N-acetylmuramate dehydrogenase [Anaeropeptidivorans aminofermentans]
MKDIIDVFSENFKRELFLINEPLKNHTSFKIGGDAKVFFMPESVSDIADALKVCRENEFPYYILGNGTNILFSDKGYNGVIINIFNKFNQVYLENENTINAQSGALLSSIANIALNNSLSGMEFASGIPGALGGAVYMNAGAYGGEMKDIVLSADILDKDGNIRTLDNNEMGFQYRSSNAEKEGFIVLSAKLQLKKGNKEEIKSKMYELNSQRKEKQPLEMPSAGSTFKRPEGNFAGKLIMESGLRGYSIGGAMVSEKHCGFVVNTGNATCKDVLLLIEHVKKTVYDKFNVMLEPEVRIIGD